MYNFVLFSVYRFDSNCITPGTEFMVRLQTQLEYFLQSKMSTDPIWQRPRIILSGHEVPGEGEHKIMDYIRSTRTYLRFICNMIIFYLLYVGT